jgi:transposase-like protein
LVGNEGSDKRRYLTHIAISTEAVVRTTPKISQNVPIIDKPKEYVPGIAHTNGIEYVWSLLKRAIAGSYHNISAKHLNAYLDELEWRFNNRENAWLFRDTIRKLIQ